MPDGTTTAAASTLAPPLSETALLERFLHALAHAENAPAWFRAVHTSVSRSGHPRPYVMTDAGKIAVRLCSTHGQVVRLSKIPELERVAILHINPDYDEARICDKAFEFIGRKRASKKRTRNA